jgi:hypothetical protein
LDTIRTALLRRINAAIAKSFDGGRDRAAVTNGPKSVPRSVRLGALSAILFLIVIAPASVCFGQVVDSKTAEPTAATTTTEASAPSDQPVDTCDESTCEKLGWLPGSVGWEQFSWATVPPIRLPLPRPGWFYIRPNGPGYYSLLDVVTDTWREGPPHFPLPPQTPDPYAFYDADFRYLEDPNNTQVSLTDPLKRIHLGDDWLLSLGGEFRPRYMDEIDYARLTNTYNPHWLDQIQAYGDLWYRDLARLYIDGIDARSYGQVLKPLANDVDHMDFLNLFVDLKVWQFGDNPLYVRVGRQEMYLGSQRLISPADWNNMPRTFQGVRAMYQSPQWSVDAFWVRPVMIFPSSLDEPIDAQNFSGLWTTYRPQKNQSIDAYYLFLSQTAPVAKGEGGVLGGFDVNTIGSRYSGDSNDRLWDFEAMYQFGRWSNQSISAGAATGGLGYRFSALPYNPTLWTYIDYASGDPHPGQGDEHETFNQLFPFGHLYFGYLDLVGRQNIIDPNLQLGINPTNWMFIGAQGHFFFLASARDALYNAAGQVLFVDPTGGDGTHVGNELDIYSIINVTTYQSVLIGYSHMFEGGFLEAAKVSPAPNMFYAQYSLKW